MKKLFLAALAVLCALAFAAPGALSTVQAQDPPPLAADPFGEFTIDFLSTRSYGGGTITLHEVMESNYDFNRFLFSYPSDGLTIYGFMNLPQGPGPFPVIIALHGYIEPDQYYTLDYTTRYADALARAGYLVLHPNLRGYRPSDDGPNLLRVGMAIDVLNLIAIVRAEGGQPGPLATADPDNIGLWGHSMGGGISLRTLTVSRDVKAAVLYAAMSGDERRNFEAIQSWSGGRRGIAEVAVPDEALVNISPINFLDRIEAAVSIHHGTADELVPPVWSTELCEKLLALEKQVECVPYPGQPHTFVGDGDRQFIQNMTAFFDTHLKFGVAALP
jgi:dipeptidyl aminopeptidase/acylaminoacyl peptidase